MDKDTRKLLAEAEAQGFDWHVNRKGHPVVTKDGCEVTTFSGTPSDRRSWNNALSYLRRAGFTWPPEDKRRRPKP